MIDVSKGYSSPGAARFGAVGRRFAAGSLRVCKGRVTAPGLAGEITSADALSWQHIYTTSQSGLFQSVRLTSDGGYIAAGTADAFAFSNNVWLVKTDANGNVAGGTCKTEQASATGTSDGALAATATSFPGVTPARTQPAATPDVPSAGNLVTQTVC